MVDGLSIAGVSQAGLLAAAGGGVWRAGARLEVAHDGQRRLGMLRAAGSPVMRLDLRVAVLVWEGASHV